MIAARLRRVPDAAAVARTAAEEFVAAAARAVRDRAAFTVALSGGSTPRQLYQLLADPGAGLRKVPWSEVHVFFGDERHVPPGHPDSNYRMAREALLDRVRVGSVHRIQGEIPDAQDVAARYQDELERFFGMRVADGAPPRFDLVLLGIGPDGHTASLFPGTTAVEETARWVAAPFVAKLQTHRITLTLPVLNRAREALFLATGPEKADALARVFAAQPGAEPPPAARVQPDDGALVWIVDQAAAVRVPLDETAGR